MIKFLTALLVLSLEINDVVNNVLDPQICLCSEFQSEVLHR